MHVVNQIHRCGQDRNIAGRVTVIETIVRARSSDNTRMQKGTRTHNTYTAARKQAHAHTCSLLHTHAGKRTGIHRHGPWSRILARRCLYSLTKGMSWGLHPECHNSPSGETGILTRAFSHSTRLSRPLAWDTVHPYAP